MIENVEGVQPQFRIEFFAKQQNVFGKRNVSVDRARAANCVFCIRIMNPRIRAKPIKLPRFISRRVAKLTSNSGMS